MAEERWNDGRNYGLAPIGLPHAGLSTPGSDTERRPMPGLATSNSVFAWVGASTQPVLLTRAGVSGTISNEQINLRKNTATGGSSVDVPTWSAGAVIAVQMVPQVKGTSTYFTWSVTSSVANSTVIAYETTIVSLAGLGDIREAIVPFFDEPLIAVTYSTDGTGTATYYVRLVGFVRNV